MRVWVNRYVIGHKPTMNFWLVTATQWASTKVGSSCYGGAKNVFNRTKRTKEAWWFQPISSMESSLCPINQCPRTWVGNHHCNDGNRKLGLRPSVPKWDRVFGQKHLPNHHVWCIINVSMYHPNISGSVPDFEVVVVPHRTWVDQVLVLGQIWPMRFRLRIKEDNAAKKNGSGERTSINFSHWGSPSHRFHY